MRAQGGNRLKSRRGKSRLGPRSLRATSFASLGGPGWSAARSIKMATSIGEKLRLERETRGIALRDISEQTRISMRYLEAIETDDYRRLPGGIFNRSFIRAYAKFVGYNEQEAIEEYSQTLREHGESPDDVTSKPQRSMVYTEQGRRSPVLTFLLIVIILALLSFGVWAGLQFYQRSAAPRNPAPQADQIVITENHEGETHELRV